MKRANAGLRLGLLVLGSGCSLTLQWHLLPAVWSTVPLTPPSVVKVITLPTADFSPQGTGLLYRKREFFPRRYFFVLGRCSLVRKTGLISLLQFIISFVPPPPLTPIMATFASVTGSVPQLSLREVPFSYRGGASLLSGSVVGEALLYAPPRLPLLLKCWRPRTHALLCLWLEAFSWLAVMLALVNWGENLS